ncbi:hypothetical protein PV325_008608 [Microctonus aethiopoides]|nr:hypothetical protein PV325_008608 [Microctonus aethiopoides]
MEQRKTGETDTGAPTVYCFGMISGLTELLPSRTRLQHLSLEQNGGQGWGGLSRGSLPSHCLPPPPGHLSQSHPPPTGVTSAFNPFHHAIEQRSPRLSAAPPAAEPTRNDLGPISVSVREVPQTESPANPGPGLLTTAAASAVTESTPPAEPTSNTNAQSPSTHHSHFQGLHLLRAGSLFGSIFAPLLPQSSWLYNPLSYHTQQYILEPDWHTLALRMAQQRLQRPDQSSNLEDLRKLRDTSSSPGDGSSKGGGDKREEDNSCNGIRETDSPDGSIEVDDTTTTDQDPKIEVRSEDSMRGEDSPRISSSRSDLEDLVKDEFREMEKRLRPSIENLNDNIEIIQNDDQIIQTRRNNNDLTVKIRLEGTVDLSTKRGGQDKENVGQDLTTRRKDDEIDVERESGKPRKDRSPKPKHVWRPY